MNWDAIGAIGEIVGSLAVVLTLGYLAVQIRTAQKSAIDTNRQSRAAGVREMLMTLVTEPQIQKVLDKTTPEYSSASSLLGQKFGLSSEEASLLMNYCQYWWWVHWAHWASIKSDEDALELQHVIEAFYGREPMLSVWRAHPDVALLDAKFRIFVDDVLSSGS